MNHANECRGRYSVFRSAALQSGGGAPRRAGSICGLRDAISEILLIRRTEPASRYWNSYDGSPSLFPLAINTRPFTLRTNVLDVIVNEKKTHVMMNAQKLMELKWKNRARLRLIIRLIICAIERLTGRVFSFLYCPLNDGRASEKLWERERENESLSNSVISNQLRVRLKRESTDLN